ncbi:MAG: hypothetical protein IPJ65_24905 [Archangiaceae bacterium]|nr:hypothetical protein [Archangiaceae bacterium]
MLALLLTLSLHAIEVPPDYAPRRDLANKASLLVYSGWSVGTLAVGAIGYPTTRDPFWRGAHLGHLVWGGVNTLIAAISLAVTFKSHPPSNEDPRQEGKNAQLSYAINAVFDVATLAVSAALWQGPGRTDARWEGFAVASIFQSLFLLGYDASMSLYHQWNNARAD